MEACTTKKSWLKAALASAPASLPNRPMHLLRKRPCQNGNDSQATTQLRLTGVNEDLTTKSYVLLQRALPAILATCTPPVPCWVFKLAQERFPSSSRRPSAPRSLPTVLDASIRSICRPRQGSLWSRSAGDRQRSKPASYLFGAT